MQTADFDYILPPDLIAQQPAPERAQARLMVIHRSTGRLEHRRVGDLADLLQAGDLLVVNDTRVIPARLFGRKADTGGQVEVLLVEESAPDAWEALLRARNVQSGTRLILASGQIEAEVVAVKAAGRVILTLRHDRPLPEILEQEGRPPLPPYIKRPRADYPGRAEDRARYQTVYARVPGAVAAPTAGLHFTADLLKTLEQRGIRQATVTLHVGPGTFQPVTSAVIEDHRLEPERYRLPAETARRINETRAQGGRIVAVGSTVVRTLETVAVEHGGIVPAEGRSALFIHPPYTFKVVDVLLTNFHLPRSTLLMMVSAWAGPDLIRRAYQTAIAERYRFYSYGDAMLIV